MLLSAEPGIDIAGEASNGREAIDLVSTLLPNLVLMDVQMPVMDGISATKEITRQHPGVVVVLISLHDDETSRALAREAGASDFIAKHAVADHLLAALNSVIPPRLPSTG
jgi:DNA-binding NarL/FixJ family response regulator